MAGCTGSQPIVLFQPLAVTKLLDWSQPIVYFLPLAVSKSMDCSQPTSLFQPSAVTKSPDHSQPIILFQPSAVTKSMDYSQPIVYFLPSAVTKSPDHSQPIVLFHPSAVTKSPDHPQLLFTTNCRQDSPCRQLRIYTNFIVCPKKSCPLPHLLFYAFMMASISSTVLGMAADRSTQPSSVIKTSFSMRTPIASSSIYIPGSTVITMPGCSVCSRSVTIS